ncbi:MAG TPA: quinate 5-dehydrogenase [Clostridia bacterium]|nr:quinate 5-dehydrogenase [Clostridia bacterium]
MKRVVSVSLGSSKRNSKVETEILGEKVIIERIGTDGSKQKAIELIKELDGQVAAFGLGGTDLYVQAGNRRYLIREAADIARAARKTPIVDGSGLKNTLERKVIKYLAEQRIIDFAKKKVLMVCAMDRFGMAESFEAAGADVTYGDLIFVLGLPIPLKSLKALDRIARLLAPIIVQLPFKYLYPVGDKQEEIKPKHSRYYYEADIIAGDFHYVKKYMPAQLPGKTIITNTVTSDDVAMLKERGVELLITTTPELNGRSFGTNVMEGLLIALSNKDPQQITPQDYEELLEKIELKPRIQYLQ